jgi:hypothetical protein
MSLRFRRDLQQYFDTIVHDKLMTLIAGRISDRHILGSINQTFAWSCACESSLPIPDISIDSLQHFLLRHTVAFASVRQRFFLEQRMRKYLQGRRQVKGFGFRRWPSAKLYKELGLYAIPQHAPYRRARMP